jgi:hypothetical protein
VCTNLLIIFLDIKKDILMRSIWFSVLFSLTDEPYFEIVCDAFNLELDIYLKTKLN